MSYDFWGRLRMMFRRERCRSCCFICEYYNQCRMDEPLDDEPDRPETEQRCGTCTERFTCPAWPGVCYPCPHYNDQDGIMEARRRKEAEEEEKFLAAMEALREEIERDGKET